MDTGCESGSVALKRARDEIVYNQTSITIAVTFSFRAGLNYATDKPYTIIALVPIGAMRSRWSFPSVFALPIASVLKPRH